MFKTSFRSIKFKKNSNTFRKKKFVGQGYLTCEKIQKKLALISRIPLAEVIVFKSTRLRNIMLARLFYDKLSLIICNIKQKFDFLFVQHWFLDLHLMLNEEKVVRYSFTELKHHLRHHQFTKPGSKFCPNLRKVTHKRRASVTPKRK